MDFNSLFPYNSLVNPNNDNFLPESNVTNVDLYSSATNLSNVESFQHIIDHISADDVFRMPDNTLNSLYFDNYDLPSNLLEPENSISLLDHRNTDDSLRMPDNALNSFSVDNYDLPSNLLELENSISLLDHRNIDGSLRMPDNALNSFSVDNYDLPSNLLEPENSISLLDHRNIDGFPRMPDNALNSFSVDNYDLPSNLQELENSISLLDHRNTDGSLRMPDDTLNSPYVNNYPLPSNPRDAEHSIPSLDFFNTDSSSPWTYNFNTGQFLRSTDRLNTQNSPPLTNLLHQSNSLSHARETSVTSLGLSVTNPMTPIIPPESQSGTDFSLLTNYQDKRLSTSTMPIISNHGTSLREEPNRNDLRRHTITEAVLSQPCQTNYYANSNSLFNVDFQANSRTNLKSYLSEYDLVPGIQIKNKVPDTLIKYSWTDIGQIREWESFSFEEFSKINRLQYLLERDIPKSSVPTPSISSSTSDHNSEYFKAKINAALSQFQGHRYLKIQAHRDEKTMEEIFLSSYDGYTSPDGKEGRIVGLRKDLNGWDLIWGKNASKLKKKFNYLESLAQLHYYLREYRCRYGYILTDTNLVVVRHGIEKTPNFGFLETKIFPLNPSKRPSLDEDGEPSECLSPRMMKGLVQEGPALLALWYLHMLASDIAVPGHATWDIDTDSFSDKSRHTFLARDADLLKILDVDVRRAKRQKGWTTPWQVKTPRSMRRSGRRPVSIPQESQSSKMATSQRDPTRRIIKNNSEAVSKRTSKKP